MNKIKELAHQHTVSGTGHKFFASTSRGELSELVADLNSTEKDKQRYAIKRIIATQTLGKDVSRLFADVVKLSMVPSLEIKKLVYLYIATNARLASDKAILAVNTFVMDCRNDHAVVRALAIRTMLCMRVEGIADYTMDPLRKALSDSDPYVRRTAVIGVAKVYHFTPKLFIEQNFITDVYALLGDPVPLVVSAAASTLAEVLHTGGSPASKLTEPIVHKLLNALSECYEWGQCRILDLLTLYRPKGHEDTDVMLERISPRLSHSNAAVVLAAGKATCGILDLASESANHAMCTLFSYQKMYRTLDVMLERNVFFFLWTSVPLAFSSSLGGAKHDPFLMILGVWRPLTLYFVALFPILCPVLAVLRCTKTCIFYVLPRRADFLKFVSVK